MALDTDFTSPGYDSFFTIVEMDSFIAKLESLQGDSGWGNMIDTDKENIILLAVSDINRQKWSGVLNPLVISGNMSWPRSGLSYSAGGTVPDDKTPDEIGLAMACRIITALKTGGVSASRVKRVKVGDVSTEYETGLTVNDSASDCINAHVPIGWTDSAASQSVMGLGSVLTQRRP